MACESPAHEAKAPQDTESVPTLQILLLQSLAVMIPWPLVGIGLMFPMFDEPGEWVLMFGGISILITLPLLMFDVLSETVISVFILAVWTLCLVLPPAAMKRRRASGRARATFLLMQSGFSLGQAAMGILMILGKSA
jgi:hypothetical protein